MCNDTVITANVNDINIVSIMTSFLFFMAYYTLYTSPWQELFCCVYM